MRRQDVTFEEDVGDQCGCHRSNGDQIECEADKKQMRYTQTFCLLTCLMIMLQLSNILL